MNRVRRVGQRGAAVLVALLLCQFTVLGGCAAAVYVAATAAATAATSAADASAHAAVAALAADSQRQAFEIALQGGAACSLDASGTTAATLTGADNPDCLQALDAARHAAAANNARILNLTVGADPRAYLNGTVPALFEVLAEVEVAGPLVGATQLCSDHQSRGDLCWADAWSAAREAG